MAFTRTIQTRSYSPRPLPTNPNAQRQFLDWELRELSQAIIALSKAVDEIQDYLETLP